MWCSGVAEVLHLHVQGGAQLGEGNRVGEVVQEANGGCAGAKAPVIPKERGRGEGRGCKGGKWEDEASQKLREVSA